MPRCVAFGSGCWSMICTPRVRIRCLKVWPRFRTWKCDFSIPFPAGRESMLGRLIASAQRRRTHRSPHAQQAFHRGQPGSRARRTQYRRRILHALADQQFRRHRPARNRSDRAYRSRPSSMATGTAPPAYPLAVSRLERAEPRETAARLRSEDRVLQALHPERTRLASADDPYLLRSGRATRPGT
jgi:hypothetical protein